MPYNIFTKYSSIYYVLLLNRMRMKYNIKIIKLLINMIDGVYPSQFSQVQAMRNSHYRNMHSIQNSSSKRISWLSPQYLKMTYRKKANHENWRFFTKTNQQSKRCKNNAKIFNKLQQISISNSRYACKTENSTPKDRLLHHNYLYECDRRYQSIQKSNHIIASKILNAKGQINAKKQEQSFRINKVNVHRLEKFNSFKRMNRIVSKSMRDKFGVTNLMATSRTSKLTQRSRYEGNPEHE